MSRHPPLTTRAAHALGLTLKEMHALYRAEHPDTGEEDDVLVLVPQFITPADPAVRERERAEGIEHDDDDPAPQAAPAPDSSRVIPDPNTHGAILGEVRNYAAALGCSLEADIDGGYVLTGPFGVGRYPTLGLALKALRAKSYAL